MSIREYESKKFADSAYFKMHGKSFFECSGHMPEMFFTLSMISIMYSTYDSRSWSIEYCPPNFWIFGTVINMLAKFRNPRRELHKLQDWYFHTSWFDENPLSSHCSYLLCLEDWDLAKAALEFVQYHSHEHIPGIVLCTPQVRVHLQFSRIYAPGNQHTT